MDISDKLTNLKNQLLDLAIRGKLVEQRPEEGSAEELYSQIQEEKKKLIAECKIKKEKPLPVIKDEEIPFDIPESWKWVRLGDVCTKIVDGDHNPPAGVDKKTEYLMLSAQNINSDKIVNLDSVRYLDEAVFKIENTRTRIEVGDILLTIVGTLGRSCIYEGNLNICFQRSVGVISTLLFNKYLKRTFDSSFIQNFMTSNAVGTAQKGFYLKQVNSLLVPLPPLEEQKRIVAKIESYLAVIDKAEELIEKILDLAIRGKLVEQRPEEGTAEELYTQIQEEKQKLIAEGKIKKEKPLPEISEEEIPFDIPKNWKWIKLGNICSIARGASPRPIKAFITNDVNGVNWIKIGDTTEGNKYIKSAEEKITQEGAKKSRFVHSGDFLLTNSMSFGHPYILDIDGCVHDGWLILSNYADCYDKIFLYYLLSSSFAYIQFSGAASGSTVKNLNSVKVANSVFPLPPLAEQKRIVAKIEELLPYCEKLK
jgi:type I restriction enzyme S subunit